MATTEHLIRQLDARADALSRQAADRLRLYLGEPVPPRRDADGMPVLVAAPAPERVS